MGKESEKLVKEFLESELSGKWENLMTFDFRQLHHSGKFGSPGRSFDCDDTNIMRAIYSILWEDDIPFLHDNNFGCRKQYRGDTMNTFHTMFGREIEGKPGFFAGLEKYAPSDELREKVRQFGKLCCNIGNYAVLPNWFARGTTFNCYRGINEWHDFFDRFLIELHKVMTGCGSQDETLQELVKVNDFCFRKFKGDRAWQDFIRILLLEDYCGNSGKPQNIFNMNYHWMNENAREKYLADAEIYLEKTGKLIRNRAERMISILKSKIR